MTDQPLTSVDEARLRARKPVPKMPPAYLPVAGSPLTVDRELYQRAQQAPRVLVQDFVLPIRSGKAWQVKAGEVVRISTPEGAQVGMSAGEGEGGRKRAAEVTRRWRS